jgi:hypothetical protein
MPKWLESPEDRDIKTRILQARNLGLEAINAEPSLQDIKFQNVKSESEKFQDQLKKLFN